MKNRALWLMLVTGCAACGGKQTPPSSEPSPPTAEIRIDGHRRLSDAVEPRKYTLELTIDPAKDSFAGKVAIEVVLHEETRVIHLHADELDIASATISRRGESMAAEARAGENEGLALVLPAELSPGPATISIEYRAPLDEVPNGLYRVKVDEEWYVYSQFEPLEARSAFPSFDEPRFKTPYAVTMRVPQGNLPLTNTLAAGVSTQGEFTAVEFDESKPMPTYLVAFAVGPFDIVTAPEGAIEGVPLRLVATRGKGALGAWMLEKTPEILARNGDEALWQSYVEALRAGPPTPTARRALIRGLGSFRDATLLRKSLALFLDGTLLAQDMRNLLGPTYDEEETFAVTWSWFTRNYDAIVEKVGPKAAPRLPRFAGGFCDAAGAAAVREFFEPPARRPSGTERVLSNTLESIAQCARRRAYLRDAVTDFLGE